MSAQSRQEVLEQARQRKRRWGREGRSRLLDEVCALCGYERKYAIKVLSGKRRIAGTGVRPRGGSRPLYGEAERQVIKVIWLAAEQPCGKRLKVAELVEDLLRDKEKDEKSKAYLNDMRTRLAGFSRDFAESKIADITTDALDDWLRALPCAPISRNNTRRILRVLFNYAIKRGLILESPAKNTSEAKVKDKPPGVLTPEQCAALLTAASPEILPAIALGLFAGLRPEAEVFRLDWASVRFEDALIGYGWSASR